VKVSYKETGKLGTATTSLFQNVSRSALAVVEAKSALLSKFLLHLILPVTLPTVPMEPLLMTEMMET
jgi:hypothetical protein